VLERQRANLGWIACFDVVPPSFAPKTALELPNESAEVTDLDRAASEPSSKALLSPQQDL
jgi:hypothetical protein